MHRRKEKISTDTKQDFAICTVEKRGFLRIQSRTLRICTVEKRKFLRIQNKIRRISSVEPPTKVPPALVINIFSMV